MPEATLRFVHITDTHISADPNYGRDEQHGSPAVAARALVTTVNALPFQPDFILHTGDVAFDPDEASYQLAAEIFRPLKAPLYYLPGNHDSGEMLQRIVIEREPVLPCDDEFEVNGVQIITVDSNQPFEMDQPNSRIADAQIERLNRIAASNDSRPLLVATHHNVLPIGAPWWDRYMRMQNGEAFHMALLPARERLLGVLHGHVHMNVQIMRDGIAYIAGQSPWFSLHCAPDQQETKFDIQALPGFNVISIVGRQMFVRQHTFTL
jgi:Icc protein